MPRELERQLDRAKKAAKQEETFKKLSGAALVAAYDEMLETARNAMEYARTLPREPLNTAQREQQISEIDRTCAQILTSLCYVLPKLPPDVQLARFQALNKELFWVDQHVKAEMLEKIASGLPAMDQQARDEIFGTTLQQVNFWVVQHGHAGLTAHALPYLAEAGALLSSEDARILAFDTIFDLAVRMPGEIVPSWRDRRKGVMPERIGSEKLRAETFAKLKLIPESLSGEPVKYQRLKSILKSLSGEPV